MTGKELAEKCLEIANNYKTLYVMGCFGAPLTASNKKRYTQNHSYNKDDTRTALINAASEDTFGFDCVNLIKGIVWGWVGDKSKVYGGAVYKTNDCPDYSANQMINYCKDVTTNFKVNIPVGAAVWCPGHIGVYVGDGLAVECTPRWKNNVQVTAVGNIGNKAGYNTRNWTKWGLLPFIEYDEEDKVVVIPPAHNETDEHEYRVGDIVTFTGNKHYVSSQSVNGKVCKPGKARVTSVARAGKHPVHLVAVAGGGSNVYGWVDTAFIARESATLAVGAKVKVTAGAKTYAGKRLASFVYKNTYDVIEIQGDRVVIGVGKAVTAAMNKKDLTVV